MNAVLFYMLLLVIILKKYKIKHNHEKREIPKVYVKSCL